MLFANKKFLVEVERAECDGYIEHGETVQPYFKGNMILTDQDGNQSVVTESSFYKNYQAVRKMEHEKPKKKQRKSLDLSAIAEGYNCLTSSLEDNSYITGQMALTKSEVI